MALYKEPRFVTQSNDKAFDPVLQPGSAAPFSGIYRCLGCGHEMVSVEHHTLPPQNHHQHSGAQGGIRWQLIVYADHKPKA